MTDLTFTKLGTVRRAASDAVVGKGDGPNMKIVTSYNNPGALVVTNTIKFARIPSNARIHSQSALVVSANDANTTLSIGIASVDNNFGAAVPAALLAANTIAAAARIAFPLAAKCGQRAWEIAALTADPGGMMEVYGVTGGATLNASSDIVVELAISID